MLTRSLKLAGSLFACNESSATHGGEGLFTTLTSTFEIFLKIFIHQNSLTKGIPAGLQSEVTVFRLVADQCYRNFPIMGALPFNTSLLKLSTVSAFGCKTFSPEFRDLIPYFLNFLFSFRCMCICV